MDQRFIEDRREDFPRLQEELTNDASAGAKRSVNE
jgi:hypothetical protein